MMRDTNKALSSAFLINFTTPNEKPNSQTTYDARTTKKQNWIQNTKTSRLASIPATVEQIKLAIQVFF